MLFNSWAFCLFIIVVLPLYYCLSHRLQNGMLLLASCIFYACWDWRFLVLLVFTTSIDFVVGLKLNDAQTVSRRKLWLVLSLAANLAILGYFKYCNFFVASAADLLSLMGIAAPTKILDVVLPVGVSFYTFHAMSYAIDIYRGKLQPIRSYLDYMLFVLYFPQLVAGPIARAASLIPQITHPRRIRVEQVQEGSWLILWGFFKKMVIADNLAPLVDGVFDSKGHVSGAECLFAVYAFAYQIYCDFSGYTDIARGLGKCMGVELMLNFDMPYLARNPSDFWRRWHISLSSWLRDYLYIPLGGSRGGALATCRNLMITMVLGGLWHGASWTFVLWGAFHGFILIVHRLLAGEKSQTEGARGSGLASIGSCILMFHLICLGWLLFRASSVAQAGQFVIQMITDFSLNPAALKLLYAVVFYAGILWLVESLVLLARTNRGTVALVQPLRPAFAAGFIVAMIVLTPPAARQFIYFQF